jgi:hypothetical protein
MQQQQTEEDGEAGRVRNGKMKPGEDVEYWAQRELPRAD